MPIERLKCCESVESAIELVTADLKSTTTRVAEEADRLREQAFSEAVERVYRRYGQDLDAFSRAVQKELENLKHADALQAL